MKRHDPLVELFRDQRAGLWKFFLAGAGSARTAEDLLQETFVKLWERRRALALDPGYEDRPALRRWLWRVARNRMIDEIRARRRARLRFSEEVPLPAPRAPEGDPAEDLQRHRTLTVMRRVVATLPNHRARRCLSLWLEDLGFEEIARRTGLDRGQVRGLLQRAKRDVIRETLRRLENTS